MIAPVLLLLLFAGCGGGLARAPDFQLTQFDGAQFRLADPLGEGTAVINFWYPSCPPCRAEMPAFQNAWRELQSDGTNVRFLGIFVPQGFDSEQDARDFVDTLGLTYSFATDLNAQVTRAFEVVAFPTTFFIDGEGKIFRRHISALDEGEIVRVVWEMAQS